MSERVKIVVPGDNPTQVGGSPHLEKLASYGDLVLFADTPVSAEEKIARAEGAKVIINSRGVVTWREEMRSLPDLKMIATCSIGTAQQALNKAREYMLERKQFGKRLAEFQALQFRLADMVTELVAARQLVRMAATKLDAGHPDATTYCAMAKRFATDVGFKVCDEALQMYGGNGYINEYPTGRLLRDAKLYEIGAGTSEIRRMLIGRELFAETR